MISVLLDSLFSILYKNDHSGHIVRFSADTQFIKQGHIPLVAYRVISGVVVVYEGDRLIGEFGGHTCWGMNEIMNDRPSRFDVWIKKDSQVCTIGKSELNKTWIKILHLFECDMLEKLMEESTGG